MNVLHMCRSYEQLKALFSKALKEPVQIAVLSDKQITTMNGDTHFYFHVSQHGDAWSCLDYGEIVLHCPVPLNILQRINTRIRE